MDMQWLNTRPARIAKYALGVAMLLFVTQSAVSAFRTAAFSDFSLRYHECRCVLSGVDPFKVWKGTVDHPDFKSIDKKDPSDTRPFVHAYAPWEYTYLMPVALLPHRLAIWLFGLLEAAAMLVVWTFAWRYGYSLRKDASDAAFVCGLAFGVAYGLPSMIYCGNYGLFCAALVLLMSRALNSRRDVLAGVLWALLMVKPQLGILYAIPLLIAWRWKTLVTAGLICAAATIPPAVLTSVSPVTLILQTKDIGAPYLYLNNDNTILFLAFKSWWSKGTIMLASTVTGLAVCAWVSWLCRRCEDWLCKCVPVAVVSLFWTYAWHHDSVTLCVPLIFCAAKLVTAQSGAEFRKWLFMCGAFLMGAFYLVYWRYPSVGRFPPEGKGVDILFYQFVMLLAWAGSVIWLGLGVRARGEQAGAERLSV